MRERRIEEATIKEYLSGLWYPAQYLVGAMLLLGLGYTLKLHGVKDHEHWMDLLTGAFMMLQVQLALIWVYDPARRWYTGQWKRVKNEGRSALEGDEDE